MEGACGCCEEAERAGSTALAARFGSAMVCLVAGGVRGRAQAAALRNRAWASALRRPKKSPAQLVDWGGASLTRDPEMTGFQRPKLRLGSG